MGVIFFVRHHQAQLMGDREYRAEFSASFPDSIAIVVVKRTAILFWPNSVYRINSRKTHCFFGGKRRLGAE